MYTMLSSEPDTIHCSQRSKVNGGAPVLLGGGGGRRGATRTDLPSCDGEVGEDAVLLVLVAGVRLQTLTDRRETLISVLRTDRWTDRQTGRQYLSFAVVPELQSAEKSKTQSLVLAKSANARLALLTVNKYSSNQSINS